MAFSGMVTSLLITYFPGVAKWYHNCAEAMQKHYGIRPLFGLFWNLCVNAPWPVTNKPGVICGPHADRKNVPAICALFTYASRWSIFYLWRFISHIFCPLEKFIDSGIHVWLVCWDVGLIMELPVGAFVLYPSSLIFHWNIVGGKSSHFQFGLILTSSDFDLVCTFEKAYPTRGNTYPMHAAEGRGSIVWFNEASIFQSFETGEDMIKNAKAKGKAITFNYHSYVDEFFTKQ